LNRFPTEEEWEALCRGCGQCCFEKVIDENNRVHTTNVACRYLDIIDRHCIVYHRRLQTDPTCIKLTPELVMEINWLPESCAYSQWAEKRRQKLSK